jgi:hypothetical protein
VVIAIVGSRKGLDWLAVKKSIGILVSRPDVGLVVSGGALGVDRLAESMALAAGKKTHIIRADWANLGRSAGYQRNAEIVDMADEIHAFWNKESRGTAHTIRLAKGKKKPTFVYEVPAQHTQEGRWAT